MGSEMCIRDRSSTVPLSIVHVDPAASFATALVRLTRKSHFLMAHNAPPLPSLLPSWPATPTSANDSDATTLQADNSTKSSLDSLHAAKVSHEARDDDGFHDIPLLLGDDDDDDDDDEDSTLLHTQDKSRQPLLIASDAFPTDHEEGLATTLTSPPKPQQVPWRSLPKKGQLALLTFARLSEPLTQTSLQAYMYYQVRSFSPDASDATVSMRVGWLQGAFTAAQFISAMLWGRCADSEAMGRKMVIIIGLLGTAVGVVGFGFSTSFAAAVCWRLVAGGERDPI